MGYLPPAPDPFKTDGPIPPQQRRRGLPLWASITITVVVVFLGGCGALAYFTSQVLGINMFNALSGGSPFAPPAKVIIGTPLGWRDITPSSSSPFMGGRNMYLELGAGDFDGDGADEIAVESVFCDNQLIEVDGTFTPVSLSGLGMLVLQAWDYDGDGAEDLLFNQYNTTQCDFYSNAIQKLGDLPGECSLKETTIADFDADGVGDLVLDDYQTSGQNTFSIYATGGTLLHQHTAGSGLYNPAFGDVDGDGAAEIIYWVNSSQTLEVTGIDGRQTSIPAWGTYHWPHSCIDLDGDGTDEVFASNHGYLNVVTGAYTQFVYPIKGNPESDDPLEKVYRADIDRDGTPELVTSGIDNYSQNSGIFFFDLAGNCTYYEEMGYPVEDFFVVSDASGDDYLVVCTDNGLTISP